MYEPVAILVQASIADTESIPIYEDDNDLTDLPAILLPLEEQEDTKETETDSIPLASISCSPISENEPTTTNTTTQLVAQQVVPDMKPTSSEKHHFHLTEYYETARAEYISASFLPGDQYFGIQLGHGKQFRTIVEITPNSLASRSPLCVGDELVSINGRSCASMTESDLFVALLADAITLVVHNEGGAPDIVESMMTKEHASDKIGMSIKKDSLRGGILTVGKINYEKAAGNTLLNTDDTLLSINGISTQNFHLTQLEAVQIIGAAADTVTVRAQISTSMALVVGEEPEVPEPAKVADPATGWCTFGLQHFFSPQAPPQSARQSSLRRSLSAQAA